MRLPEVLFLCVCMENKLIVYIYAVVCANTMYSDGVAQGSSGSIIFLSSHFQVFVLSIHSPCLRSFFSHVVPYPLSAYKWSFSNTIMAKSLQQPSFCRFALFDHLPQYEYRISYTSEPLPVMKPNWLSSISTSSLGHLSTILFPCLECVRVV